ncbi:MAG: hypothetical protein ACYTHM_10435 [Planctomycetota bacterium]
MGESQEPKRRVFRLHCRPLLLLLLWGLFFPSCSKRESLETYRRERAALAETVGEIHAAHLQIVMRRIPPKLIPVHRIDLLKGIGSIQDLHESSEMFLEDFEKDIRALEEEVEKMKRVIEERKGEPNPFATLDEAYDRDWELYLELKRVEFLQWRRR